MIFTAFLAIPLPWLRKTTQTKTQLRWEITNSPFVSLSSRCQQLYNIVSPSPFYSMQCWSHMFRLLTSLRATATQQKKTANTSPALLLSYQLRSDFSLDKLYTLSWLRWIISAQHFFSALLLRVNIHLQRSSSWKCHPSLYTPPRSCCKLKLIIW